MAAVPPSTGLLGAPAKGDRPDSGPPASTRTRHRPEDVEPELVAILRDERDRMTGRIDFLTKNRDSIAACIDAADEALAKRLPKQKGPAAAA
jgi:hypothetical protein